MFGYVFNYLLLFRALRNFRFLVPPTGVKNEQSQCQKKIVLFFKKVSKNRLVESTFIRQTNHTE